MSSGFIYILSNPCLSNNLLKIGLSAKDPEKRAQYLSKSTSIAADFVVEYKVAVPNVLESERRIHLVLKAYRFNQKKEFFLIPLEQAISIVAKIVSEIETIAAISKTIYVDPTVTFGKDSDRLSLSHHKLLFLTMAATINNKKQDQFSNPNANIVDGFLGSAQISEFLGVTDKHSQRIMIEFVIKRSHQKKKIDFLSGLVGAKFNERNAKWINIFDSLSYYRGQMAWKFSSDYRIFFFTD